MTSLAQRLFREYKKGEGGSKLPDPFTSPALFVRLCPARQVAWRLLLQEFCGGRSSSGLCHPSAEWYREFLVRPRCGSGTSASGVLQWQVLIWPFVVCVRSDDESCWSELGPPGVARPRHPVASHSGSQTCPTRLVHQTGVVGPS